MSIETNAPGYYESLINITKIRIRDTMSELDKIHDEVLSSQEDGINYDHLLWSAEKEGRRLRELETNLETFEVKKRERDTLLIEMTQIFEEMWVEKMGGMGDNKTSGDNYEEHF